MHTLLLIPASISKLSAQELAAKLVQSSISTTSYATHAVRSGREYFAEVCQVLNLTLAELTPEQAAVFKACGPVQVLRNACNREQSTFTIRTSKHGGIEVIGREEATKATGRKPAPAPVKTAASPAPESDTNKDAPQAETGPTRESLIADVTRLNAALAETRAALAAAEARANAAEARAETAEARAKSAERALASAAKRQRKPTAAPVAAAAAAAVAAAA